MNNDSFVYRSVINNNIKVVNLCDSENIGKTISDKDFEIEISSDYFGNQIIDETKAIDLLKNSNTLTLVGNRIVELAIKHDLVSVESVKKVEGISFALVFKFTQ